VAPDTMAYCDVEQHGDLVLYSLVTDRC